MGIGAMLFELEPPQWLADLLARSSIWMAQHGIPDVFVTGTYMIEQAMIFTLPFVVGLFVFDRLVTRPDGYTRCGLCGVILENLRNPWCPECHRRI